MNRSTPNTCQPSKSHTSADHPYRHVDEYVYGENGEKVGETHGIKASEAVMNIIDRFLGKGEVNDSP